jgi:hypothetical protein
LNSAPVNIVAQGAVLEHGLATSNGSLPRDTSSQVLEFPGVHPSRVVRLQDSNSDISASGSKSVSTTETNIDNEIVNNCEAFLEQSQKERKAVGRLTRKDSRVVKRKANRKVLIKTFGTQTQRIEGSELRRRKAAGECQRCAWPRDRKGSHKTLDCFRWKRLINGTAPFPKQGTIRIRM